MKERYFLTVRSELSAAHALRHYQGKCEQLHGHNFGVEICVVGDRLDPKTGMLIDFGILKRALAEILQALDHRLLNEIAPFDEINPSSENLARHIGMAMMEFLQSGSHAERIRLHSASVSEKNTQIAVWKPGIDL